jgi:hypothetical protein
MVSDPTRTHLRGAGAASVRDADRISELLSTNAVMVALALVSAVVVGAGAAMGPKQGLGAVIAVAAGLVVLRRPVYGGYTLVAAVPALSGLERGLPIPGFRLSEVMVAAIAGLILVTASRTPRWGAFDWLALGYVVATATLVWFNVIRHGGSFTGETFGTLLGPLQFLLLYRAILTSIRTSEERVTAMRLLLFVSVPISLTTLFQQFDIAGVRSLMETLTGTNIYESTIEGVPRATGPFPHWHNLGGYLFLVLLLGFSLLLEDTQRVIRKRTLIITLVPALAALVQTASFAPIIGMLAGAIFIGIFMGRGKAVFAWLGLIVLAGGLLFGPLLQQRVVQQFPDTSITSDQSILPQTIAFRYEVWRSEFVPVIKENIITGYGPSLPPRLYFNYAESLYVTFLLRGGIILLFVYLGLMAALALRARRIARCDDSEQRVVARVVLAAVPLLMVIDIIATYFLDSGPAPLLWVTAGLMGTAAAATRSSWPARRSV